jgi:hypothetical protein
MIDIEIDTTKETKYEKQWYSPETKWPAIPMRWCRLPNYYSFDLDRLRNELTAVEKEYAFKPFILDEHGHKRMTYQGICLTAREDSEDPEYDGMKLFTREGDDDKKSIQIGSSFKNYFVKENMYENGGGPKSMFELNEKIFSKPTRAYTGYIAEVIEKFHSAKTKCRMLKLKPRGVVPPHVDFPYYQQIRVHAALYTNDDVWFEVEGEKFKIPADGNFYWFDTGKNHAVVNEGNTDRVTLSVNLSVYDDQYNHNDNLIDLINQCKI